MNKISLNISEQEVLSMIASRTIERPITASEIRQVTGRKIRDIRAVINKLRKKKITVLSNQYGYFMASDRDELIIYLRSFNGRINEMMRVHKALQETSDNVHEWKSLINSEVDV